MSFSVSSTLEKMNSRDKDFRYMATADLLSELNKDFKLEPDSEKRLTEMLLKLLQDTSNQVQELVVKCLGPFCKKIKEPQIQQILDVLCGHMLSEKKVGADELRDISSIGLKTIIFEIPSEPPSLPALLITRVTPRLISGISSNEENPEIIGYCLDALNDLLKRFGSQMISDHEKILKVVQPQLSAKRTTSRKRAIGCLGHLAVTIPDGLFADLIKNLIKEIESSKGEKLRTYIQAIGAVSRSVGYRLGKFLNQICPLIIKYSQGEQDDELRENCFQCFESLILRCPKDITPYLETIISLALEYIKYDPNYAEDDGEEADEMETEEGEEEDEEGEGDEENYSDDDDMSWKVRRSSAKCLAEIISTRPEMLKEIYEKIAPVIIARFKEREESVKLDIFITFVAILQQTNNLVRRNPELSSLTAPLRELVPKVVAGITKQLKEKSVKTRSGSFALLRELVSVLPGCLNGHVAALVPGIQFSLGDRGSNANLKIESLSFLRLLLATHDAVVFHPHIKVLALPVFKAARDNYYRISAESLRVCCELVRVLRPEGSDFDYKAFVPDLFSATLEKLKVQDIDQEVKESAITCTGLIIANFGDELGSELPGVLNILLDRLSNEITRITAVKALETIARSKLRVDLSPILSESIKELSSFLRKANRQLKQSALSSLGVIVKNYGTDAKCADLFPSVLAEVAPLISDFDLHLSHLGLELSVSILSVHPPSASTISVDIFPKALTLLNSTLLQGLALESLLALFSELVKINAKSMGFDTILDRLLGLIHGQKDILKQTYLNVSKGVAAVCLAAEQKQRDATVSRFIKDLSGAKDELSKHLALYSLGEIGRKTDLTSHDSLQQAVLSAFDSTNEDTRQAASFALGNIAVGNLQKYLPQVLDEIKKNPKAKYLLLHSLREIIVRESSSKTGIEALKNYEKNILPLLYDNCESEEEGTRNVVAECLGKLAIVSPEQLVPTFVERTTSASANTRSTVVTALKFSIVEKSQEIDKLLLPEMSKFLDLLKDSDLNVRRNTLLTLNYGAHHKPILVREILPTYLPLIFGESKTKPELIREVDLGPFKHKVDDGLEIRKAAYECMYTLLDSCLDRLDIPALTTNLVDGLKDHYDIKMLSHLMLIRIGVLAGPALLEGLDQLVEPLRSTISTKPKEGAVKQEVERNEELIRSALRAILAITKIPNVESNLKFEEFLKQSVRSGDLGEKFAAIKAESEHIEGAESMDLV